MLATADTPPCQSSPVHTPSQKGKFVNESAEESSESDGKDDPWIGPTSLAHWLREAQKHPSLPRFLGKSGMIALLQAAFKVKLEYIGDPTPAFDYIQRLSKVDLITRIPIRQVSGLHTCKPI